MLVLTNAGTHLIHCIMIQLHDNIAIPSIVQHKVAGEALEFTINNLDLMLDGALVIGLDVSQGLRTC